MEDVNREHNFLQAERRQQLQHREDISSAVPLRSCMPIDNIGRRTLLKAAGAAGSVSAFAGCIGGDDGESENINLMDIEEIPTDEYENELNVWNWYVQWVEWGTEQFEQEYPDIETTTQGYSQPTQWFSQLQSGSHDIDHIGTTPEWTKRAADAGFLAEIPYDRIPNWETLDDRFTEPILEHLSGDNGGVYAIPHSMSVFPSLVYNNEYFDEPPNSWDILWDDEFENEMAIMAHYSAAPVQLGALYTGQDPNDPEDYDEIREVLINQKELLTTYGTEHESHMQAFINEEIILGTHTSGRINIARHSHDADHISWTVPEEGSVFGIDLLIIPDDAPNPRSTMNFLNFMLSEDSFREFVSIMNYKPPINDLEGVLSQDDRISDELLDDINWGDELFENVVFSRPLTDEVQERFDEVWTEVQAA
ncbi:ABC transporter substrate-binding protein (plasmid) [Haloferacaceae archaeon DSL9]